MADPEIELKGGEGRGVVLPDDVTRRRTRFDTEEKSKWEIVYSNP